MKYNICISSIILSIILVTLLIGCKNVDNTNAPTNHITEEMYEKVSNVYKVKEFELPDDFNYVSYNISYDGYIYIYGFIDLESTQLKYNFNGELLTITNIAKLTDINAYVLVSGIQPNGNYVIVTLDNVYLISPDGEVIAQHEYVYDYSSYLHVAHTNAIYFVVGNKLYVFDSNLELIAEIESTDTLSTIFSDNDDNIIVQSYTYKSDYFILDINSKTLNKYNKITVEQNSQLYFGFDYTPYIINDKGIHTYDDEPMLLLNWENSDIIYKQLKTYKIVNQDIILCEMKDYFDTLHKPVILERVPDNEIKEKVIINFAITGFDNVGLIEEAIALFNRDNDTYRVITTDYTKYNTAPDYDQAIEKMNQDMIAGNMPDIVMIHFTMFNSIDSYTDKNIFADLSEAIDNSEHELLKCVQTSYCRSDKIYYIPVFMKLDTIVTKSSVIGENESFNLDKLYSLADNIKENQALFSKYVDILSTALYDFVDYDNKTCNFESNEFIRLLEFQKNIGNYIDKDKGAVNSFVERYYLTSSNLYESIWNDELYFLQLPLYKLSGYMLSKICYGNDDFNICGYPTSTGNASMLHTEYTFGITEQSKVKKGAWEFIEFLLSDTIQNSETLTSYGLPITVSGIEKLINTYAEYYLNFYLTDSVNNNLYSGDVSIIGWGVKETLPDDHPNKKSADHVVSLTEKDKQKLLDFFNSTDVKSHIDDTVSDIVDEEFNEYYADAITAEEAASRIQKRVFIYLNE